MMTDTAKVLTLFADANPVPDAAAYVDQRLTAREQGVFDMSNVTHEETLTTAEKTPRGGWRYALATAAAVLVVGLVGVLIATQSTNDQASSGIDVVGEWLVLTGDGVDAEATYLPDGTFEIRSPNASGTVVVIDSGTYIASDTFTFISGAESPGCAEGDVGSYSLTASDDSWTMTLIEDSCEIRSDGATFTHAPPR